MKRHPRPRFSWVRWFWSDFDGETKIMTCAQVGQLLRLLHLQLDSRGEQCIPSDTNTLTRILGESPSDYVLSKFDSLSPNSLRHQRLAEEYFIAMEEYEVKSRGGRLSQANRERSQDTLRDTREDTKQDSSPIQEPRSKNQELQPQPGRTEDRQARPFTPSPWYATAADRVKAETESQRLCREIADLTDRDGMEVWDEAQDVPTRPGSPPLPRKMNPAAMSPDRLANTILDLRKTLESAKREAEMKRAREATQARREAEKAR